MAAKKKHTYLSVRANDVDTETRGKVKWRGEARERVSRILLMLHKSWRVKNGILPYLLFNILMI